jgi:hypothetical protein
MVLEEAGRHTYTSGIAAGTYYAIPKIGRRRGEWMRLKPTTAYLGRTLPDPARALMSRSPTIHFLLGAISPWREQRRKNGILSIYHGRRDRLADDQTAAAGDCRAR